MFNHIKPIVAVKVLGVRMAEETKFISTVNSTMYCCLFIYEGGSRDLAELTSKEMKKYLQYVVV